MSASPRLKKTLSFIQNNRCFLCGLRRDEKDGFFHVHRFNPGRNGGTYTTSNSGLFCVGCHFRAEGLCKEELELLCPYGNMESKQWL